MLWCCTDSQLAGTGAKQKSLLSRGTQRPHLCLTVAKKADVGGKWAFFNQGRNSTYFDFSLLSSSKIHLSLIKFQISSLIYLLCNSIATMAVASARQPHNCDCHCRLPAADLLPIIMAYHGQFSLIMPRWQPAASTSSPPASQMQAQLTSLRDSIIAIDGRLLNPSFCQTLIQQPSTSPFSMTVAMIGCQ